MLYHLGALLKNYFGPARLLQSYAVLIVFALYISFFLTEKLLPKFFRFLPQDRGREFTLSKEQAKGKPTGAGVVFISFFVLLCLTFIPLNLFQCGALALTWLMMLTGYLDDRSLNGWGEYRKALLDFIVCCSAAFLLAHYMADGDGRLSFWLPFTSVPVQVPCWLYIVIATVMLWVSVNTTNCTDGVDGLSSSLVILALFTLAISFYIVFGHVNTAAYLLVPHLDSGASWGLMTFCLAGVLLGYLWHNAFPSSVLMGDAGSRALGFYLGFCVMVSGNPFMFLVTSTIIFINGGMGLLKVALKRFFHISIFSNIRFPLHDHYRKNHGWSPTQVLIKFLISQLLITMGLLGIFFKVR